MWNQQRLPLVTAVTVQGTPRAVTPAHTLRTGGAWEGCSSRMGCAATVVWAATGLPRECTRHQGPSPRGGLVHGVPRSVMAPHIPRARGSVAVGWPAGDASLAPGVWLASLECCAASATTGLREAVLGVSFTGELPSAGLGAGAGLAFAASLRIRAGSSPVPLGVSGTSPNILPWNLQYLPPCTTAILHCLLFLPLAAQGGPEPLCARGAPAASSPAYRTLLGAWAPEVGCRVGPGEAGVGTTCGEEAFFAAESREEDAWRLQKGVPGRARRGQRRLAPSGPTAPWHSKLLLLGSIVATGGEGCLETGTLAAAEEGWVYSCGSGATSPGLAPGRPLAAYGYVCAEGG